MKTFLLLFIAMIIAVTGKSQIISQFTWDANPVGKAAVGPDAISYYATATSATGGKTGNGLNAGPDRHDINLVLPGATFDVAGIDISVDFRREESEANFFERGGFAFGMRGGKLFATYVITNGTTSTTVNTGDLTSLLSDNAFHTYRFRYDNNLGIATIYVDGSNVYTTASAAATPGKALYWTGAGNATIGNKMDGAANNVAILDNMIIQSIPVPSTLPLKLLSFTAAPKGIYAAIGWSTTQETNVAGFMIERSADGSFFSPVKTVKATNSFSTTSRYQWVDSLPIAVAYYRLKMTDADGSYTYSEVRKVSLSAASVTVSCFPNPAVDYVNIRISSDKAANYVYTVSSLDGKAIFTATQKLSSGVQLVSIDLTKTNIKGVLLVQLQNTSDNTTQTFKIVRQ